MPTAKINKKPKSPKPTTDATMISQENKINIRSDGSFDMEYKETVVTFGHYQKQSRKTAKYPDIGNNFVYPALGLCGESGEVAEKIKKVIRDKGGIIDDATRKEIKKELGDVLWYLTQIASELGLSLEEVATENIKKLFSRLERGKLGGNGDNR